jgi:shikimate kinase
MILKLKRTPGIYLVGFMGSGKTTIGRLLGQELGWRFADLDDDVEAEQEKPITEIFAQHGEAAFRTLETAMLRKRVRMIERGMPTVLSLGGGAFVHPGNFELIENNGVTIFLNCPIDRALRRVSEEEHRPLARDVERFTQLYHARKPLYEKADYRIPIESDDPQMALKAILKLPLF